MSLPSVLHADQRIVHAPCFVQGFIRILYNKEKDNCIRILICSFICRAMFNLYRCKYEALHLLIIVSMVHNSSILLSDKIFLLCFSCMHNVKLTSCS